MKEEGREWRGMAKVRDDPSKGTINQLLMKSEKYLKVGGGVGEGGNEGGGGGKEGRGG